MTITNDLAILAGGAGGVNTAGFMRNRIINGTCQVFQRATNLTTNNTQGYYVDRYWGFSESGTAATYSQASSTGLTGFPYAIRMQRNSGNTSTNQLYTGQIIESVNLQDLQGQSVSISFYARAGANFSATSSIMKCWLRSGTVADQGLNQLISGWTGATDQTTNVTLTTSWQRFTITSFTVPSNCQELTPFFSFAPTGTAGANDYVDITGVQLEVGSVATPFEREIYSNTLAKCQRYFNRLINGVSQNLGIGNWIALGSATTGYGFLYYPPMRASPTPTVTAGSINFYAYIGTSSSVALSIPSNGLLSLTGTGTGWPAGGQGGVMLSGSATSLIIDLASEL